MNALWHEIQGSIRSLQKVPGFAIAIILTLALGIGANGAIFTAISSVLLQPLPYPDSQELVQVYNSYPKSGPEIAGTSIPDYLDRKEQAEALEDLFIYTGENFSLNMDGQPQRLLGYRASPSMFSTLRVQPALGAAFTDANMELGADKVAVISHELWQDAFAGDLQAIGTTLILNGENYQVLGVMPIGFLFPNRDARLWVPFAFSPEQRSDQERGNEFSSSIGRLKPGASIEQLNAQMDAIVERGAERLAADPEFGASVAGFIESTGFTGRAQSWHAMMTVNLKDMVWLLQGAVLLVLLIACANVANLQLVRMTKRQRELSLRSALGAGVARLAGQLVLESLLLALAGAVIAVIIALAGIQLIKLVGLELPERGLGLALDGQVLLYMLLVAIVAALVSALIPVLVLGRARLQMLREGGRGTTGFGGSKLLQQGLVVAQTALALALLVSSALMLRSFINLNNVDPGFDSNQVVTARVALPDSRYPDNVAQNNFYQRLQQQLSTTPGVTAAGIGTPLPFTGNDWTSTYSIEGDVIPDGMPSRHGHARIVDGGYFQTLGIELQQGRFFGAGDAADATPVVIIDRYFAEQRFPGEDPIGQRIARGGSTDDTTIWWTVIGVVESIRHNNLDKPIEKETYYFNYPQFSVDDFTVVTRSELPESSLINSLREVVQSIDPELPIYRVTSMNSLLNDALLTRQAPMLLLVAFAAVALILAAVGIYSVLSFMVAQRRREIGVRMAIGARAKTVVQMVLRQGSWMLGIGCVIGIVAAIALGRLLSAQLFGVPQIDLASYLLVIVMLGSVGLLACWWPARRAAHVHPMEALRYE